MVVKQGGDGMQGSNHSWFPGTVVKVIDTS